MVPDVRILLVCLGNICRSPTAEAAVREAASDAGIELELDSAGIGDWHIGEEADPRMRRAATEHGLELTGRARQVDPGDLQRYDLLLAMDRQNQRDLLALAPDDATASRVRMFREFDPDADSLEVPDPYFGGEEGFSHVVRIVRAAAKGLVESIQEGRV